MGLITLGAFFVATTFGLWTSLRSVESYQDLGVQNPISKIAWKLHLPWRKLLGGKNK